MHDILSLRKARGLTQEAFAELCGISRSSLARYESGAPISRDCLIKIANSCGISLDDLLGTQKAAQPELDGEIDALLTGAQRLSPQGRTMLASYLGYLLAQEQQGKPEPAAAPPATDG